MPVEIKFDRVGFDGGALRITIKNEGSFQASAIRVDTKSATIALIEGLKQEVENWPVEAVSEKV